MSRSKPEPLSGHPKYEKIKDLNSGTFGFVQLCRDKASGELCAIKFIERGEKARAPRGTLCMRARAPWPSGDRCGCTGALHAARSSFIHPPAAAAPSNVMGGRAKAACQPAHAKHCRVKGVCWCESCDREIPGCGDAAGPRCARAGCAGGRLAMA
eukprot:356243-Chlamydomonas_euryale.AAC.6